ncbi:sugar ABC transporter permease [Paenibacillus psychroresistens]|uniref:Sugar ABC transporter permease n=1 Tax=Paenibacillus psychroresistens TaxID=1778678 RepID=A0A6B8RT67_9BACL|nr:ABC transporter permease subunit [Paenibacillus psychroresistens]QGQ98398.1 sugar ABC transporter permease [Paenibacillus psychroresistens]
MISIIDASKKFNSKRFKQNVPLLIMFVPVIAFFLVVKYLPMFGLVIAFKDYNFADGIFHSPWAGFKNFQMLFNNPETLGIVRNTLVLGILSVVVGFPFPIMIAILLNEARKLIFKRFVQTLVYLPHFFSWVIVGGMVITLFSQESGAINHWITKWTGNPYPFLYSETSWIAIFLGSGIWKEAGFSAIIYLAALTSVDPSLYEAAGLDGANKWRQIWHITLPGISTTIVLMMILSIGHVIEVGFDQVYVLQNNVVSNVSEVISTYIFRVGLQNAQFSLTAAMGLFESVVAFIMVMTANQIARRFNQGLW